MAGISKRIRGSWVSSDYGVMKTATDIITTLPADIYPNAETATVGLKGQTVQSGTPTPTTPIQPSECGERTGNLLNLNRKYSGSFTTDITKWMNGAATMNYTGDVYAETEIIGDTIKVTSKSVGYGASFLIEASPNTTYTVSFETDKESTGSWGGVSDRDINGTVISHSAIYGKSATFTTHGNCAFLNVCFRFPPSNGTVTFSKIMLNIGSTPLPYEPYGYKLTITSANTTTPVYLGEIESTRRIKKLVLTGNEAFTNQYGTNLFSVLIQSLGKMYYFNSYCTHYKYNPVQSGLDAGTQNGDFAFQTQSTKTLLAFKDTSYSSAADFKTYLAQQYAAGTPVTVWYVLANPETAVVNEPLMKIGDYADEVANVSIPVTAGANTLSVDTTVQPSEVTVNYKGWHSVQSVHERSGGQWD